MSEPVEIMHLESIRVDKRMFAKDGESDYRASISMSGKEGSITVNLNSEETVRIVNAVADALANAGESAARRLRDSVLASVKTLGYAEPTHE